MTSETLIFMYNHLLEQWLTGGNRGKEENAKI